MTIPLGNPFTLGATGVTTTARFDRMALGSTFRPSSAAVAVTSGFLVGAPNTQGESTLVTDVLLRLQPFTAVIQGTHNSQQGQYIVPNGTQRDLAVVAKDASLYRRSLVVVRVADSLEAGVASSPTTDGAWLERIDGPLAASNPALPALPANALAVGELSIPSTASGQPTTWTPYNPRTTTRGGVLPVVNDAIVRAGHGGDPPLYDGQPRWHPLDGLQVGATGVWQPPIGSTSWEGDYRGSGAQSIPNLPTVANGSVAFPTTARASAMVTRDAANQVFTIQRAGVYFLSAVVRLAGTNATERYCSLYSESLGQTLGAWGMQSGAAGPTTMNPNAMIYLPAGATFRVIVFQNSGVALNTDPGGDGGWVRLQIVRMR